MRLDIRSYSCDTPASNRYIGLVHSARVDVHDAGALEQKIWWPRSDCNVDPTLDFSNLVISLLAAERGPRIAWPNAHRMHSAVDPNLTA
jgi:hypothetical protein